MTSNSDNPQPCVAKTTGTDTDSALDALFAEARKLMQEMQRFLRQQRQRNSK